LVRSLTGLKVDKLMKTLFFSQSWNLPKYLHTYLSNLFRRKFII